MNIFKHKHTKTAIKYLIILLAFFVFMTLTSFAAYLAFEKKYTDRVYPGIYIGSIPLGGKTQNELQTVLNDKINSLNQDGIIFSYQGKQAKVFPTLSSVEGDLAYEIINFSVNKSISEALELGRENDPIKNLKSRISIALNKKQATLYFSINKDEVFKLLKNNFSKFEIEPISAQLKYENDQFEITNEKLGNVIDYKRAIDILDENLKYFNTSEIILDSKLEKPAIYKDQTIGLEKEADAILSNAPFLISFNPNKATSTKLKNKEWPIDKNTLSKWLTLKKDFDALEEKEKTIIGLNENLVNEYFSSSISPKINIPPQNAKFEVKDGRVVEFQQSKDGVEVNFSATFNLLENTIIKGGEEKNIFLVTTDLKSNLTAQDVNDFGINEIVGTGHSNFSGSPKNRRHNIAIGAAALNGLLIKPGEEFSLITALGDIDGENGYLPELVIKGSQTIAEFGGGLCQIGTTLFRTVVQSGLPVTMRRNHSYRVSYYEPAGTDATIYDPWPDFKFINDTQKNILIQTRIEGDDIYFDFWGSKDGRQIKITEPTIYNIVKPAPTKLIETLDLPVGVKKCTEKAHNGADAYFDYTVTYSEDKVVEKRFSSHYVPWREVCLIGVEKLFEEEIATSTTESIQ